MKLRHNFVYLVVSADEYELPMFVADTYRDICNKFGISQSSFYSFMSKKQSGRNLGYKILKVDYLEDDDVI